MIWSKLGCVFMPNNHYPWMYSHASNPVAEHLYDDIFRIYFSCRDNKNISSISFIEVNIKSPLKILSISKQPVLVAGEEGTFDDSGVSLGCIAKVRDKKFLYYVGWNLGVTVPWRNSIGLANHNEDTNKYEKVSKAPIVDRNHFDPFSISYPFVLADNGTVKMWYGSNLSWGKEQKDMSHVIKYAISNDGINWHREGIIALDFKNENEYAISKPFVLKENEMYKMWK